MEVHNFNADWWSLRVIMQHKLFFFSCNDFTSDHLNVSLVKTENCGLKLRSKI